MATPVMKPISMAERNSIVMHGETYFYLPDEQAWVEYKDISMPGDTMGLVAPSRPRYKLYGNGGITLVQG